MKLRQGITRKELILKSDGELYDFACRGIAALEENIVDNHDVLKNETIEEFRREAALDLVDDYRIVIHWMRVKILYKHCKYE